MMPNKDGGNEAIEAIGSDIGCEDSSGGTGPESKQKGPRKGFGSSVTNALSRSSNRKKKRSNSVPDEVNDDLDVKPKVVTESRRGSGGSIGVSWKAIKRAVSGNENNAEFSGSGSNSSISNYAIEGLDEREKTRKTPAFLSSRLPTKSSCSVKYPLNCNGDVKSLDEKRSVKIPGFLRLPLKSSTTSVGGNFSQPGDCSNSIVSAPTKLSSSLEKPTSSMEDSQASDFFDLDDIDRLGNEHEQEQEKEEVNDQDQSEDKYNDKGGGFIKMARKFDFALRLRKEKRSTVIGQIETMSLIDDVGESMTSGSSFASRGSISNRRLSRRQRCIELDHTRAQSSIELGQQYDKDDPDGNNSIERGNLKRFCSLHPDSKPMGYMHIRNAVLGASYSNTSADGSKSNEHTLASILLAISSKPNFCDVELVGENDEGIAAPKLVLACHGAVLEEMLFPVEKGDAGVRTHDVLYFPFASKQVLVALVHYCATLDLPKEMENDTNETNVRFISQLFIIAQLLKMTSLVSQTYRTARLIINKKPNLAASAFDECVILIKAGKINKWWGFPPLAEKKPLSARLVREESYLHDDLKGYALEYIRESPFQTLLDGGVQLLSPDSIEMVMSDPLMDADELNMFMILNSWVHLAKFEKSQKIDLGRKLMQNIQLCFIEPTHLTNYVKKCEFVSAEAVDTALTDIEFMMANLNPEDLERVEVEGAGEEDINGLYVRMEEDIGLGEEEILFVKEANEEEFGLDYGLYLWKGVWSISSCVDYSSILYTREVEERRSAMKCVKSKPPKWGWKCAGGSEPAPSCTWKPRKAEDRMRSSHSGMAPSIDKMKDEGVKATNADRSKRASITLSMMCDLPIDEDFENEYASLSQGLAANAEELRRETQSHLDEIAEMDCSERSSSTRDSMNDLKTFL
mmetsp:Transcript_23956/g.50328  ORF Transcript_23956/g.50328 Transcript_23956/m.50328 type:complete len:912 (+) Transcript_23956:68-2803(+)